MTERTLPEGLGSDEPPKPDTQRVDGQRESVFIVINGRAMYSNLDSPPIHAVRAIDQHLS